MRLIRQIRPKKMNKALPCLRHCKGLSQRPIHGVSCVFTLVKLRIFAKFDQKKNADPATSSTRGDCWPSGPWILLRSMGAEVENF